MRVAIVLGCAALAGAVSGCSRPSETTTATPATPTAGATSSTAGANPAATSTFAPPRTTSRLDYGSRIERRFRKLDKNQDDKLAADEFPRNRGTRMLKRMDKNGDSVIDATEWSSGMLASFDKRDVNKDGSLTSNESGKKKGGRGGRRQRQGGIDDNTDEVDSGM